jgi:hypothetical protein
MRERRGKDDRVYTTSDRGRDTWMERVREEKPSEIERREEREESKECAEPQPDPKQRDQGKRYRNHTSRASVVLAELLNTGLETGAALLPFFGAATLSLAQRF